MGEECSYAHSKKELRQVKPDKRRKTRPCMYFFQDGYCPFGPACHFLHELEEKRLSAVGKDLARFLQLRPSGRLPVFKSLEGSE